MSVRRLMRSRADAVADRVRRLPGVTHRGDAVAHEPPYAHRAGGGEILEGMVLAIEPGCYWPEGGGLRVEDNFLITADGAEKLSPFPDGVVRCGT